jgi:ABC-type branched-subunit amino acid transport system ATPase component
VMSICDRILVLHFGTLIMNGSPDEVLQSKKVSEVYLGS